MLLIEIPENEYYDEINNRFIKVKKQKLQLEHSLISISKWESRWNKPFLSKEEKTVEESIDYVRCMTINNPDPSVYYGLDNRMFKTITDYINAPMTATWFSKQENTRRKSNEIVTSEVIYYWMVALNIPFECEKWHFNRLYTLIRVCDEKSKPPKKMSKKEIMKQNQALNAARRKKLGTKG